MTDNDILEYIYSDINGNKIDRISRYKIKNIPEEMLDFLLNRYNDNSTDDIKEIIYRIKNHIDKCPTCEICNKKLIFNGRKYPKICSDNCRGKKSYLLISTKYNTKNLFDIYREQTNKTMLEKYGVKNCSQSEIIKRKKEKTFLERYGIKNNFAREDVKRKNIEIIKEHKNEILAKRIKTNNERYGVDYYLSLNKDKHLSEEHKKKIGQTIKSEKFQKNRLEKLKEHNTINNSYIEEAFYIKFKRKYNEVIRQYTSAEYPFFCDFYIPEINAYIEIQGSHYHHYHPFNENDINDINELNKLKLLSNGHKQYKSIIETWTIYDPKKRKIAKENNLNFIEIFPDDYKNDIEIKNIIKDLKKINFFNNHE